LVAPGMTNFCTPNNFSNSSHKTCFAAVILLNAPQEEVHDAF